MSNTASQVLIPLLRRVMPSLIAADIIGVQPMVGPAAGVFSMRARYRWDRMTPRRYPVAREVYRHFLRVNDRRRTQNGDDLAAAGYASVTLPWWQDPRDGLVDDGTIDQWCDQQLGRHAWLRFPRDRTWWFSLDDDAVLFRMVWA